MPIFRFPSRVPYFPKTIYSSTVWRTLYWVGGTDSWDGTAGSKWSLSSGGAGGEPPPNGNDRVCFDANSGSGTVTLTTSAKAYSVETANYAGKLYYPGTMAVTAVDGSLSLLISGLHYLQVVSASGSAGGGSRIVGSPIIGAVA